MVIPTNKMCGITRILLLIVSTINWASILVGCCNTITHVIFTCLNITHANGTESSVGLVTPITCAYLHHVTIQLNPILNACACYARACYGHTHCGLVACESYSLQHLTICLYYYRYCFSCNPLDMSIDCPGF